MTITVNWEKQVSGILSYGQITFSWLIMMQYIWTTPSQYVAEIKKVKKSKLRD